MNKKTLPFIQSLDHNAGRALVVAGTDQDGSAVTITDTISGHQAAGKLKNGEAIVDFSGKLGDDHSLELVVTKPVEHKGEAISGQTPTAPIEETAEV